MFAKSRANHNVHFEALKLANSGSGISWSTYVWVLLVQEWEWLCRGGLSQVVGQGGRVGLEQLGQAGYVDIVVVIEVTPPAVNAEESYTEKYNQCCLLMQKKVIRERPKWQKRSSLFFWFGGILGFQPQGPNFRSPLATMLALRLDCSTAELTTPQTVLPLWKLVELKMLDFSDIHSLLHSFARVVKQRPRYKALLHSWHHSNSLS